ncbi:NUDIX domain-containing protein [Candidatus Pacearchaeota archaeon]|nr:NUDIX domain-containing protein [Candidatus Pacearchaeota archaeon]
MSKKIDRNLMHYVVVTGIIVKDGKFLITKRSESEKAFPGQWTVPGGKLEVLDYALREKDTNSHWYNVLEDLLRKEVKEEVGLEIKNIGYVTSLVYLRDDGVPCLIVSLWAEPVLKVGANSEEISIKLDSSLTDYAWVDIDEARNYNLIEGIYEELEILDRLLKKGDAVAWKRRVI